VHEEGTKLFPLLAYEVDGCGMRTNLPLRIFAIVCVVSLFGTAQNPAPIPKQAFDLVLTRGRIIAVVSVTMDAGKVRVGDPVRMGVIRGMSRGGAVLTRAKLFGKVVEAVPWSNTSPESRLGILIEKAEVNGQSIPLKAVVAAQIAGSNDTAFDRTPSFKPSEGPLDSSIINRKPLPAFPLPVLPRDTQLYQPTRPLSPTILVSQKRNVVLRQGMQLVFLDRL